MPIQPPTRPVAVARARVASLSRSRAADDPELIEARRSLRTEHLAHHVQKVLAEAPPLTPEQRHRIARLLTPAGGGAS